jgi:glycosyltransferase involved in cell wall biosynthesis
MKNNMRGLPCTFTGYLEGDDLVAVYVSSDLFVFPSTTDTSSNVVLETGPGEFPSS